MLKKLLALFLVLTMLFSVATLFAGCDDDSGKKKASSNSDDEDEEENEEEDEDDGEEHGGKNDAWYDKDEDSDEEDESDEETEPGTEEPSGTEQEGYDGSDVTIRFAHTMGSRLQDVLEDYIEIFNERYPNIHVEHESYGGWADINDIVNAEIAGGDQPNIVYCYPEHVADYKEAQAVVALDELIENDTEVVWADGTAEVLGLTEQQTEMFIDSFYAEGQAYGDGRMYSLPMSKSTEVLYYNKTFFEANSLSVPTTWEEMETVCRKIKEIDPTCIPLGYDSEDNLFITLCAQYGFDYTSATGNGQVLFNNDDCQAMVKELRRWYEDGLFTTQNLYGAYTSGLFTEMGCYMSIASSGGASYQIPMDGAFEVGVAPIPQADPNSPKAVSQGPSLCILKDNSTTDQEIIASWLFMEFLTTNVSFQTEFSMSTGYMPVVESVYVHNHYTSWLSSGDGYSNLTALVVNVGLENADYYFTAPAFVGSSLVREQVGDLLVDCMSAQTGDVDGYIEDAFEEAYQACQ